MSTTKRTVDVFPACMMLGPCCPCCPRAHVIFWSFSLRKEVLLEMKSNVFEMKPNTFPICGYCASHLFNIKMSGKMFLRSILVTHLESAYLLQETCGYVTMFQKFLILTYEVFNFFLLIFLKSESLLLA